eukprot:TRINITY_DN69654_c0_g1_i1.p1 TRINITY_DN69654_c0_g1~~TRINITY_DN69654_c0_g1_i1.p1  ORF type:complete len:2668 (+),score=694.91 TRINITY_DN69654_c0_g1_i1:170-8173(+)
MPGSLRYFCVEWQRFRRTILLDAEAQYELARTAGGDGCLDPLCHVVYQHNIPNGWYMEFPEKAECPGWKQLQDAVALHGMLGPGSITDGSESVGGQAVTPPTHEKAAERSRSKKGGSAGGGESSPKANKGRTVAAPGGGLEGATSPDSSVGLGLPSKSSSPDRPSTSAVLRPSSTLDDLSTRPGTAQLPLSDASCRLRSDRPLSPGTHRRPAFLKNVPTASIVFLDQQHPFFNMNTKMTKDEFVHQLRSALEPKRLFEGESSSSSQYNVETSMTPEQAEDLFDSLLLLQSKPGSSTCSVTTGRAMDQAVEMYLALSKFRRIAERGASSLKGMFDSMDLTNTQYVAVEEMKHFLKSATEQDRSQVAVALSAEGADISKIAETFFSVLDLDQNGKLDFKEMRRQLALAAPPRLSMLELMGHFQMKYGYGCCGLLHSLDRVQLFNHLCEENLDMSPEDVHACFRGVMSAFGQKGSSMMPPSALEFMVRSMPLVSLWGIEPAIADRFYDALGARCLQSERKAKMDASLPPEAMFDVQGLEEVCEDTLRRRFDGLFDRYVKLDSLGSETACPAILQELRQACCSRYINIARSLVSQRQLLMQPGKGLNRSGTLHSTQQFDEDASASDAVPSVPSMSANGSASDLHSTSTFAMMRSPRNNFARKKALLALEGPKSLFPNIGDVLACGSTRLHAGKACVIRYRLMGSASFCGSGHQVLKNEREVMAWPISRKVLGDTPFVGLVPRGLRWTSAGGGGFYLGTQPVTKVDPNMRADLPKEPETGLPNLYGTVEIVAPSLARISRAWGNGAQGLHDEHYAEFELRLFCSRKHRVISCIGEPLMVHVVHQNQAPAVSSLQVRCHGRTAHLRWAAHDLGDATLQADIDRVHLRICAGKGDQTKDWTVQLASDTTEYCLPDLALDAEYEFRIRFENRLGPGPEGQAFCRINQRCTAPTHITCSASRTNEAELKWHVPEVTGNEQTRDRYQIRKELIECYEATLKVDEESAAAAAAEAHKRLPSRTNTNQDLRRTASTGADRMGSKGPHMKDKDADKEQAESVVEEPPVPQDSARPLQWCRDQWKMGADHTITCQLTGLRPDTHYNLHGLCAVNSTGPGQLAKPFSFWTIPQMPVVVSVRVTQGEVYIGIPHDCGAGVRDYEIHIWVTLRPNEKEVFNLGRQKLRKAEGSCEEALWELPVPFKSIPVTTLQETHTLHLRAQNPGGSSEWSSSFDTHSIAKQQGADQAQAGLVKAIEARDIDELLRALDVVQDMVFKDDTHVQQAQDLVQHLMATRDRVHDAMRQRDHELLAAALEEAHRIELPNLGESEALLQELQQAVGEIEHAPGIDALRVAILEGQNMQLPDYHLSEPRQRLERRIAAQKRMEDAVREARVPVLVEALENAKGMSLPREHEAQLFLMRLQDAESALLEALCTGLVEDLALALEKAATSGLREEGLIAEASVLLRELRKEQLSAGERLQHAVEGRHPDDISTALNRALAGQVPCTVAAEAEALLVHLNRLLSNVEESTGVEERMSTLQTAYESQVPKDLLVGAERKLESLKNMLAALADGDLPELRKTLRLAENAGLTWEELADARDALKEWEALYQEVQVAMGVQDLKRLRAALAAAEQSTLNRQLLEKAQKSLAALERGAKAEAALQQLLPVRDYEVITGALRELCDSAAISVDLIQKARVLLLKLKDKYKTSSEAMHKPSLLTLSQAIKEARAEPALLPGDIERMEKVFQNERLDERLAVIQELRRAMSERNFRAIDHAIYHARKAAMFGVSVDTSELNHAAELSRSIQRTDANAIQEDLNYERRTGTATKFEGDMPPTWSYVEALPVDVVSGSFRLGACPAGKHLLQLPREVVNGMLYVQLPDKRHPQDSPHAVDVTKAFETIQRLENSIRRLLRPQDVLLRTKEHSFFDNSVHLHLRQPFSIHVCSPESSSQHYVTLLYEVAKMLDADTVHAVEQGQAKGRHSPASAGGRMSPGGMGTASFVTSSGLASPASPSRMPSKQPLAALPDREAHSPSYASEAGRHSGGHHRNSLSSCGSGQCGSLPHCFDSGGESVGTGMLLTHLQAPAEPLSKYVQRLQARPLRSVRLDVSWKYPKGVMDHLDLVCTVFTENAMLDLYDCRGLQGLEKGQHEPRLDLVDGTTGSISVAAPSFQEAERTGSTSAWVRLDLLPERATDIVFTLHVHSTRDLSKFTGLEVKLWDEDAEVELQLEIATVPIGNQHVSVHPEAIVLCTLYKSDPLGLWDFLSLASPCRGTYRDYGPLMNKLLGLGFPRSPSMQQQVTPVLKAMSEQLGLQKPPKPVGFKMDKASNATVNFKIELLENAGDGDEICSKLRTPQFQAAAIAALKQAAGERFDKPQVDFLEARLEKLQQVMVTLKWEWPGQEAHQQRNQYQSFLDATCIAFDRRALQEVVDYRGASGVRIIHNGVVDYAGAWIGMTDVGDATGGTVRPHSEELDLRERRGSTSFLVDIEHLPATTTDLYFIVSAPVHKDMSVYSALQVLLQDAGNPEYIIGSIPSPSSLSAEAMVLCRMSRSESGKAWMFGGIHAGCSGSVEDYRQLILMLRAMQDRDYKQTPAWPYMDPSQPAPTIEDKVGVASMQMKRLRLSLGDLDVHDKEKQKKESALRRQCAAATNRENMAERDGGQKRGTFRQRPTGNYNDNAALRAH